MATAEGKPETNKQESKPEAKTETKEVEENQEPPLKYKAWVLKVSIHCEGCKRKVEKTLRKIDGVYEAYADLKQQKATVKAKLHVNAETLIKKLVKKGRHAELWPEKAEQKEKKQGKSKNKDKQSGQANTDQEAANSNNNNNTQGSDKEKETEKNEVTAHQDSAAKSCENGSHGKNNGEGCKEGGSGGGAAGKTGGQVKESKAEVKQTVTLAAGNQSPVAEKKGGGGGGDSEGNGGEKSGGGGSGSKKNKKKGQKVNANFDEGEHSADAGPACIGSHFSAYGPHGPVPMPSPASHSPPRQHHMYEYPSYYHAPPVYVTSYNTAYPSSSYTASYYASPPPYSHTYMQSRPMSEPRPSDLDTYPSYVSSSQPSDSFEMFSDENPNACSIM